MRTRKLTWSGIDRNDESWMDASLYGAMRVVRAGSSAIRPVRPGSAIEENRKRRRAGETLADPSVIRTVKPNPAVVRGFMSGGLRGGQSFRDMANDWNANVVRLQLWSVGPKPTWTEENYPVFLDRLETAVRQARDAGLKVIPVAFEVPCELNGKEMWEVPGVEEAFIRYWTGIVERLAPYRDACGDMTFSMNPWPGRSCLTPRSNGVKWRSTSQKQSANSILTPGLFMRSVPEAAGAGSKTLFRCRTPK